MTTRYYSLIAGSLASSSIHAASITANAGNPAGAEGYTYHLSLNPTNNDTSEFSGTVGSWSWQDTTLPGEGTFWRHQSDWLAITLTDDALLNIQVGRSDLLADSKLFPSFTIFRGFNDTMGGPHFASNTSDLQWEVGSQLLEYFGHRNNSALGNIEENVALPAGDYTILLGGNAVSELNAVNVNYLMALSASPIPEPSTSFLGFLAGMAGMCRRQRSKPSTR